MATLQDEGGRLRGTDTGEETLAAEPKLVAGAHVFLKAPVGRADRPALAAFVALESGQVPGSPDHKKGVHSAQCHSTMPSIL